MKIPILLTASLVFLPYSTRAGKTLDALLREMGEEAAEGYLRPLMQTLGAGLHSCRHNSSQSLSFMGVPMGISVATAGMAFGLINDEMKSFDKTALIPIDESRIDLSHLNDKEKAIVRENLPDFQSVKLSGVPSVYGTPSPPSIRLGGLFPDRGRYDTLFTDFQGTGKAPLLDSNGQVNLPVQGLVPGDWWFSLPNITFFTFGFKSIPVMDNIQLGISYLPPYYWKIDGIGEHKYQLFSYKVQHEWSALVPRLTDLGFLHGALYWAQSLMTYNVGKSTLKLNAWSALLNLSADFKIATVGLGAFAGAGVESTGMACKVKPDRKNELSGFSRDFSAERRARFQTGIRVSPGFFDIWGEFNMGKINSFAVGITLLAFNGL